MLFFLLWVSCVVGSSSPVTLQPRHYTPIALSQDTKFSITGQVITEGATLNICWCQDQACDNPLEVCSDKISWNWTLTPQDNETYWVIFNNYYVEAVVYQNEIVEIVEILDVPPIDPPSSHSFEHWDIVIIIFVLGFCLFVAWHGRRVCIKNDGVIFSRVPQRAESEV